MAEVRFPTAEELARIRAAGHRTDGAAHHCPDCEVGFRNLLDLEDRGQPMAPCPSRRPRPEAVDHPAHYGGAANPFEAIKVIEAWGLDFCLGNAVKYLSRAGKKGDEVEDLKKAAWYIARRIQQLEAKR